jgi:hypothetical protein
MCVKIRYTDLISVKNDQVAVVGRHGAAAATATAAPTTATALALGDGCAAQADSAGCECAE